MPWLLAAFLLVLSACGGSDDAVPDGVTSVVRSERTWTDTTRAAGTAAERRLRVLFWQPEPRRERPLVLLAHGFGGLPEKFDAFAGNLARSGYEVAAPAFPLTNELAPGGHQSNLGDVVNQPADLSFVLDQILAAAASPGDPLAGAVDATRIAVLGHSLGGQTVIALTRKQCCRDERVAASLLVAPLAGLSVIFGADAVESVLPTLIVHGTADGTIPFALSVELYDSLLPPRLIIGVHGAGHSDLVESQAEPPIAARAATGRAASSFLGWAFAGDAGGLEQTLAELEREGHLVEQNL